MIILHTFDYEVFLKRSGTVQRCMLEPTDRLIEIFSRTGGRATFFIDTFFIGMLKRQSPAEYRLVSQQLLKLADMGHRIELHLHPSWRDAVKHPPSEWITPDFTHYSLFSLLREEVKLLFEQGMEVIHEILKSSLAEVNAFRAGGWSVGDDNTIAEMMRLYGIAVESSAAAGMYREKNSVQYFDFRKVPRRLPHWRFKNHPAQPDEAGDLMEIPISTYRIGTLSTVRRKCAKKIYAQRKPDQFTVYGDGRGIDISDILNPFQMLHNRISTVLPKYNMITLQNLLPGEIDRYFEGREVITTISHPKSLSPSSLTELLRLEESGLSSITLNNYYQRIKNSL